MSIYLRKIYILFITQIFSAQKYISQMRYIIFTFSFIFFSVKKIFFSENIFQYKTFFPYKNIFSANNVYFVKNTNIFKKKFFFFFFNVVLQQMNNHSFHCQQLHIFIDVFKNMKGFSIKTILLNKSTSMLFHSKNKIIFQRFSKIIVFQ